MQKIGIFASFFHLWCLFFGAFASFDLSDLENGVYHKLEITRTPIVFKPEVAEDLQSELETVHLGSVFGQLWSCSYKSPSAVLANVSAEPEQPWVHVNITQLMAPYLNNTSECFKATKGWWTYEICPWRDIVQYHDDRETKTSAGRSVLGVFAHEYNWTNSSEKDDEVRKKYHSQRFENGTLCDLTGTPRSVDVQYLCLRNDDPEDGVIDIQEPETCRYVIQVHVHKLCQSTVFRRVKSGHILVGITCSPALSEDKYQKFKLSEETKARETQSITTKAITEDDKKEEPASKKQTISALEKELVKALDKLGDAESSDDIEVKVADELVLTDEEADAIFEGDDDQKAAFEAELAKVGNLRNFQANKLREKITGQFESIIDEAEQELSTPVLDREKARETLAETAGKIVDKIQQGDPRISQEALHPAVEKAKGQSETAGEVPKVDNSIEIKYDADPLAKESLSDAIKKELEKAGIKPGDRHVEIRVITGPGLRGKKLPGLGAPDSDKSGDSGVLPENSARVLGKMIAAVLTSDASIVRNAYDQQNLEDNYAINYDKELEEEEEEEEMPSSP